MKFTKEDIELIEKFIEIKNRGYYVSGEQLTEAYNRILNKNVNITNCGSCLRGRVQELENALNHYREQLKKAQDASKPVQVIDDKVHPFDDPIEEENNQPVAKRVGRPKKN